MEHLKAYLEGRAKNEFAGRLGITPSQLSQYLSGFRRPGFEMMLRIRDETAGAVGLDSWSVLNHAQTSSSEPTPTNSGGH